MGSYALCLDFSINNRTGRFSARIEPAREKSGKH
jgi:hypothetical protein